MTIEQVILSVGSALVYSLVFYAKNRSDDPTEDFNFYKLGGTLLVGAVIGAGYGISGVDFSQAELSTQIAAYSGSVAIVETLVKIAWRQHFSKFLDT